MNGDGKPDIAVTSISGHMFSVYINNSTQGNIAFSARLDFQTGQNSWPRGIAIYDLDVDGKPDIVLPDHNKIIDFQNNTTYGTMSVYRNISSGGVILFAPPISYQTGEYPRKVCVGDMDGDNKPDLAVANHIGENVSVFRNNCSPGNINFVAQSTLPVIGKTEQISLGDLDGDDKCDLVVSTQFGSPKVSIFRNTSNAGSITFAPRQEIASYPLGFSIGDIDENGKPDIVVANYGIEKATIFRNISTPGAITFSSGLDYISGSTPLDIIAGDIDGDGNPDLSLSNGPLNKVSVLRMSASIPAINLGSDTSFCQGDSLVLNTSIGGAQYLWSTGATVNSIIVKQTGTYWLRVTTATYVLSDTINVIVKPKPIINFGSDTTLCEGSAIMLNAFNTGATYLWSNGLTTSSISVTQSGFYSVLISLEGCENSDTIGIIFSQKPRFNLGNDTTICKNQNLLLDPGISGLSYLWQDGSTFRTFLVTEEGLYRLTVTNACGSYTDEIKIITNPVCLMIMPNAFTPNNDGNNDLFRIPPGVAALLDNFSVYDRWGNKIFTTKDANEGWNGKHKGANSPAGLYVYTISAKIDNKNIFLKGFVVLIR